MELPLIDTIHYQQNVYYTKHVSLQIATAFLIVLSVISSKDQAIYQCLPLQFSPFRSEGLSRLQTLQRLLQPWQWFPHDCCRH